VIPNAGTALLRRLLFSEERFDMAQFSRLFGHIGPIDTATLFRLDPGASVKKVRNCIGAADRGEHRQAAEPTSQGLVGERQ
jgi:hypothetical protein